MSRRTLLLVLPFAAVAALLASPLAAQNRDPEAFLRSIPEQFPPSSMPWLLDVAAASMPEARIDDLGYELRKAPDLAESVARLDELFRQHFLAQSPMETRLESVREAGFQSPVATLAMTLSRQIPELMDTPANTALRAAGHELARRFVRPDAAPRDLHSLLLQAPSARPGDFLRDARRFLDAGLFTQAAFAALSPQQQADLVRNVLAGALIDETASVIQFQGRPATDTLIELAREALKTHAALLAEEARALDEIEGAARSFQESAEALQAGLERQHDEVVNLGEALQRAASPSDADKERYRRLADEYLRSQTFVDAVTSGAFVELPDPAAAVQRLIPLGLETLNDDIRKLVDVPKTLGAEVDRLLAVGREAMGDLDAFVQENQDQLSLAVQVEGVRFDAARLASGVFRGCFDAAVASSGLTVDFGGGQLDVGSLVSGLASNDILAAVGGSSLNVDIGGKSVNVVGIATSLATGNFLGAIGGLFGGSGSLFGGLFGGGGPDLGAIRAQLEQIQRSLAQISRQLQVIERKIDEFREEFRQAHLETMSKLGQLSIDLTTVRLANRDFFKDQAASCKVVSDILKKQTGGGGTTAEEDVLQERSYAEIQQLVFNPVYKQVQKCHDFVLEKIHQDEVPMALTLMLNLGQNDRAAAARQGLHDFYLVPHLDFFEAAYRKKSERDRVSEALLDAQPTLDSVGDRRALAQGPPARNAPTDQIKMGAFDPFQIIDPGSLATFIDNVFLMQRMFPYFNFRHDRLVSEGCVLAGFPCLGQEAFPNDVLTRDRLLLSLRLVNTALAQQALFNGDVLLLGAVNVLKTGDLTSDDGKDLQTILDGNPIFADNLAHHLVRERLEARGFRSRSSQYALARLYAEKSGGDTSFLNLLFPNSGDGKPPTLKFFLNRPGEPGAQPAECKGAQPGGKGMHVVLPGGHCVPLPSQEAFASGALEVTPAWKQAAALRAQLLEEWAGYSFRKTLNPKDRHTFDSLQLLTRALQRREGGRTR